MRAKLYGVGFFLIILGLIAVPMDLHAKDSKGITVSAAISLKPAFEEIAALYKGKVIFNFGGSGALARQIEAGAPVDVFASAAQKDMDDLHSEGLIMQNTKKNFAGNEIVLIAPAKSTAINKFSDLQNINIKKIAVGNPKTVPAGRYAMEVLSYLKMSEKIRGKIVFGDHVRQVLDYAARGEVDAAIVYATDAIAAKDSVRVVEAAPKRSHSLIVYPIAVIKDSKNENAARDFIALVLSEKGMAILKKYGFSPVD